MNLSEYRESGIIEAYVLGVLDPERGRQLENDLETNVALRKELQEVEKRLANFKRNFTRSESGKQPKSSPAAPEAKKSVMGQRIVLGILIFLVIGLTFLFLSTLYQSTAFQTEVLEVSEQVKAADRDKEILKEDRRALEMSLWKAIQESESVADLRAGSGFSGTEGFLLEIEETDAFALLLENLPFMEEENYLQLWGRSGDHWRRMGMIPASELNEGGARMVHLFPMTNLRLQMVTEESESAPGSPNMSKVVLRR